MKLFHYSKLENWERIKEGDEWDGVMPGLHPQRSLTPAWVRKGWEIMCTFCLTEPEPSEWKNNKWSPHIWSDLMQTTGDLLLEINPGVEDMGHIFVVDFEHQEGLARKARNGIKVTREAVIKSHERYVESIVPLDDYLKRKMELKYKLPEVIVTKHMPISQVFVHHKQPEIGRELKRKPGDWSFRRKVARVPELRDYILESEDERLLRALEKEDEFMQEYEAEWGRRR